MLLAQSRFWLPPDISTHGSSVDQLINVTHWFMGVLFVGWGAFFVYCLVRFRARPGHAADPRPIPAKTSKYAEIGVAIFEAVLLIGFSMPAWAQVKYQFPAEDKALTVRMTAEQFAWNFHYSGADGVWGRTDPKLIDPGNPIGLDLADPHSADDVVTVNNLHIPVHQPIIVQLSSKDVIHSFWIPVLRVKQDVIPGMSIPVWFEARETGEYDISCAQLCGNNHYKMRGRVMIKPADEFAKWLESEKVSRPLQPADQEFEL